MKFKRFLENNDLTVFSFVLRIITMFLNLSLIVIIPIFFGIDLYTILTIVLVSLFIVVGFISVIYFLSRKENHL